VNGILDFFTDDLVYIDQTLGLRFSSKAELGAFIAATFEAMPDLSFELTDSFASESRCAAEAVMRGTQVKDLPGLPARGVPFTVRYAIYGTLRDGKLARIIDYWNFAELTA
jgi:steroid delta-isomerase-like uncharacterized protein